MAIGTAELERVKDDKPGYEHLERMIRDRAARRGITLTQLSLDLHLSRSTIAEMLRHRSTPSRQFLIALADHFDESREEWQAAGGYSVDTLPQDRGWTTRERELARSFADVKNGEFQDWMEWFATLTPEQKKHALRTSLELRSRHEPRDAD